MIPRINHAFKGKVECEECPWFMYAWGDEEAFDDFRTDTLRHITQRHHIIRVDVTLRGAA